MLQELTQQFKKRYSKQLVDLNSNVISAALVDEKYIVPRPVLGPLGGTVFSGTETPILNVPAEVKTTEIRTSVYNIVYQINIPYDEAEIASANEPYFNYYFDEIMRQALSNYAATVGGPDKARFGSYYLDMGIEDNKVFTINGEHLTLSLRGKWGQEQA